MSELKLCKNCKNLSFDGDGYCKKVMKSTNLVNGKVEYYSAKLLRDDIFISMVEDNIKNNVPTDHEAINGGCGKEARWFIPIPPTRLQNFLDKYLFKYFV